MKPQDKPHYVNNANFSQAVVEYVTVLNEARDAGTELPIVPDYIARCFLKIAEGLSNKEIASALFLSESTMGSRCSYSDSGNFGTCPIAGVESVGSMCTCPSPEGQMTGTVVR